MSLKYRTIVFWTKVRQSLGLSEICKDQHESVLSVYSASHHCSAGTEQHYQQNPHSQLPLSILCLRSNLLNIDGGLSKHLKRRPEAAFVQSETQNGNHFTTICRYQDTTQTIQSSRCFLLLKHKKYIKYNNLTNKNISVLNMKHILHF